MLWLLRRLKHKLEHYSLQNIKKQLLQYGLSFVIIFVAWEIIEDVLFPLLFIWLGNNVNPWFLTGAPISWILCLHPIAVPVIFTLYIKLSGRVNDTTNKIEHEFCNHDEGEPQD